jgi:hypothetical protein
MVLQQQSIRKIVDTVILDFIGMNISIIKSMCFRNNDDQMRFGKIFGYFVRLKFHQLLRPYIRKLCIKVVSVQFIF